MEESITSGLSEYLREAYALDETDIRRYSPLVLAYIGDAVYDLWIRTYVVMKHPSVPDRLHRDSTRYVSAVAQTKVYAAIKDELNETETDMIRRGRNARPHSMAKNASAGEYHKATGLECLMGYLYLTGQTKRLTELIHRGICAIDEEE